MLLLRFFDGTTFFIGLFLAWTGGLVCGRVTGRGIRRSVVVAAVVGIVLVLLSAVAQPLWAYAIWLIAAAQALVSGNRPAENERSRSRRLITDAVLTLITLGLLMGEVPFHLPPRVVVPPSGTVFVVGDSLSAGIGRKERCWPERLGDMTGMPVVNLAVGGATAESAAAQLQGVIRTRQVVVVEIGGNDMFAGTSAADFREHLGVLLSALHAQGHRLVMFELPLYPFRNAYGTAQRGLAEEYDVTLVPKRYLTGVLGMRDGTLDGLHFSQKGHDAMAQAMAEALVPENPNNQ